MTTFLKGEDGPVLPGAAKVGVHAIVSVELEVGVNVREPCFKSLD